MQICRQYCNGRPGRKGNASNCNKRGQQHQDDVHGGGSGSYTAQDVSNAFNVRTEDTIGTKEVGTRSDDGSVEKDDDAITFGQ